MSLHNHLNENLLRKQSQLVSRINRRIIIEGTDGVGKDTFIKHFLAYINGEGIDGKTPIDAFDGKNMQQVIIDYGTHESNGQLVRKKDSKNFMYGCPGYDDEYEKYVRNPKRYHTTEIAIRPSWAELFSACTVHSMNGSPESFQFIKALNEGTITDKDEIATEYLQVHYDLERLCKTYDVTQDIILMNRSLVSYYTNQIKAHGLEEYRERWEKLWRFADQKNGILIHLTMPREKLKERLETRQAEDFRGEIETEFFNRLELIEEGIEELKARPDWLTTFTFDTSVPVTEYWKFFDEILTFRNVMQMRIDSAIN